MRNSRRDSAGATRATASSTWPWTERRSLAIALLVSIALHAWLLASWRMQREGAPLKPAFVVTLTGAFVVPARPQVAAPPPVPAAPPPQAVASAPPPQAVASAPPAPSHPVASAAAPAASRPREAVAASDLTFYRPEQLSQGPVPQSDPAADRVSAAHLVGRRLLVTVFVDAEGAVRQALVAPYEISAQQAAMLQEAVAAVHFTPASIDGQPVASQVQSRLCFDDSGLLDTSSPGCWRFDPQPAH